MSEIQNPTNIVKLLTGYMEASGKNTAQEISQALDIPLRTVYRWLKSARTDTISARTGAPELAQALPELAQKTARTGTPNEPHSLYEENIKNSICAKQVRTSSQKVRNKYTDEFVAFWERWPKERRVNKAKAFKAFQKIIKHTSLDELLLAICEERGISSEQGYKFTPHPERWLRDERFNDPVANVVHSKQSSFRVNQSYEYTDEEWEAMANATVQ